MYKLLLIGLLSINSFAYADDDDDDDDENEFNYGDVIVDNNTNVNTELNNNLSNNINQWFYSYIFCFW